MEDKHLTAEQRAARAKNIQRLAAEIIELAGHLNASNDRLLELIAQLDREKGVPPPHASQSK
jgi:hypothetical protein